jgi:hypothetical protein
MDSLVENERTKLFANALDRLSTAFVTVGVLAPLAASIYNIGTPTPNVLFFAGFVIIWLSCAIALHLGARTVLKGLRR